MTTITRVPRWRTLMNSMRFLKDPIPLLNENKERFGHTYHFYLGGVYPAIFTADPTFIQHVLQKQHRIYRKSPMHFEKLAHFLGNGLLTSDGEYWLRQRRLIQPGFHRQRLSGLTGLMQAVIRERMRALDDKIEQGGTIDIYQEMLELAFNIIARSIFSVEIPEKELHTLSDNITRLQEMVIRLIRQPYLEPWLRLNGTIRRHEAIAESSYEILLRYIRARKSGDASYDDLLQMLLDARYEDTGEGMTEKQLLDEVNILFVAGHETSANAMAWTWYLLAQHPEVVSRICTECETILQGREPGFEDLPKLEYLTAVIEESMRLYPPAWITDRMAAEDDEFNGIPIPKGTFVVTYIYGAHHAREHWDDPEAFRPERFLGGKRDKQHPFAYLPFGGGPRLCIGNNFAMMEMQLALAMLITRYNFSLVPGQQVKAEPLVTLRPKEGIRMVAARI